MYCPSFFEHSLQNFPLAHHLQLIDFFSPLFSQTCAHSFPHPLSFDRLLQNTSGVGWRYSLTTPHSSLATSAITSFPATSHSSLFTAFLTPFDAPLTKHSFVSRLAATLTKRGKGRESDNFTNKVLLFWRFLQWPNLKLAILASRQPGFSVCPIGVACV
jgi:hypothetical protein